MCGVGVGGGQQAVEVFRFFFIFFSNIHLLLLREVRQSSHAASRGFKLQLSAYIYM